MKTTKNVLTATLLLLLFAAGCEKENDQDFYMYLGDGQKRTYEISATKMLIKSETLNTESIKDAIQRTHPGNVKNVYDLINELTMVEMQNTSKEELLKLLKQWNNRKDVIYASPILLDETGREVGGFTNQVLVRLKSNINYSMLQKKAAVYNIKTIKPFNFDDMAYILTLSKNAQKNAMQVANELYETGLFEYAEPNLILFIELENCPTGFNSFETITLGNITQAFHCSRINAFLNSDKIITI